MEGGLDPQILRELITASIPFGKYKGTRYYKLPVSYLEWFKREGFPAGKMGMMLSTIYEIKLNGLEFLLHELIRREGLT